MTYGYDEDEEEEKPPPPPAVPIDPRVKETWDYLMEVMGDYETFLENVGNLGYSAPQLLYYRDEVQEILDELQGRTDINVHGAWQKVIQLDTVLRAKAQTLVDEIGHKNFIQYQIQNDPPRTYWWWWLNRVTAPPVTPPRFWEFWKYQNPTPPISNPQPKPSPDEYQRNPEIAKLFQRDPDQQA